MDPCAGVTATSSDPASVACRAAPGVNANIAANGGVFTLNQADFQGISGFDRGNPDLTEEEGNSWTIGAVIQPEDIAVLDKFDFTVDYYKIDIERCDRVDGSQLHPQPVLRRRQPELLQLRHAPSCGGGCEQRGLHRVPRCRRDQQRR